MPSVLDNAKEATYTALGLNVLFLDEISERLAESRERASDRFAGTREQLHEQLEIARKHGKKAQSDWEKQAEEFTATVKNRLPFDVEEATESIQARVQPVARRTWEAAEPVVNRLSELAPAPIDGYMKDGAAKIRERLVEATKPAAKPAPKVAAKKAPARKPAARKTTARKPAAKKPAATS